MSKWSSLIDFLCVGVAKCGTTALHHYLQQHPEISLPKHKETKYFVNDFFYKSTKLSSDDYVDLFLNTPTTRIRGEVDPIYALYYKEATQRISQEVGDPKIIIMIREPWARMKSAYNHYLRLDRTDREPVNKKLSLEELLTLESEITSDHHGEYSSMHMPLAGSVYYPMISHFRDNFSQVKIVVCETLLSSPQKTMREVYNFLWVDECFVPKEWIYNSWIYSSQNWLRGIRWFVERIVSHDINFPFISWLKKVWKPVGIDRLFSYIRGNIRHRIRWQESEQQKIHHLDEETVAAITKLFIRDRKQLVWILPKLIHEENRLQ